MIFNVFGLANELQNICFLLIICYIIYKSGIYCFKAITGIGKRIVTYTHQNLYYLSLHCLNAGPQWPSGKELELLITGCHLCVGSTPTSENADKLSQYDPDC